MLISINKEKLRIPLYIFLGIATLFSISLLWLYILTQKSIAAYPNAINPTEEFCLNGYFLFPESYKIDLTFSADIEIKEKTTLLSKDIFAKEICIKPTTLLPEATSYILKTYYLDLLNLNIFQKKIEVTTLSYPQVTSVDFETEINNNQVLKYNLDYSSNTFDYSLVLNDKTVPCTKDGVSVLCDVTNLGLEHENSYKLNLVSKYKDNIVKQLKTSSVTIRTAVAVQSSSIQNNEVIQSPSIPEIDITLNKEVEDNFKIIIEDSDNNAIKSENTLNGQNIQIYPKENFKQSTTYFLKIDGLMGVDGSTAENEYVLEFSIDDGPKIKYTNIGSGFSTTGSIVLTFNQNIKTQDIKEIIKFNSGTDYSYTISRNQIIINPNASLNLCTQYGISIGKGLVSSTGLISSASYSYTLKTTCKRVSVIGTSVQGRGIYAYSFGTGSNKIVFFGSIHGSESNTQTLLNKWIVELDNNSDDIPADKTIIVIPTVNPDGVANNSRFNADGVDLNRNFDTPSWVSGTYLLSSYYPTGGGAYPFSEPESIAIRDFISQESPYLTLTYHSAASYVIPTNTSNGPALGRIYSQLSGYRYVPPDTDDAFTYDITGTFEEWAENHGYNGLVIELSSAYSDQFAQNVKAMWNMVTQ